MLDNILFGINKPGRYIGQEWNVSRKDFDQAEIKFGLCFPDLYEVGMSNLGLRIIYGILNNASGVVCERFFAPAADLEKVLREQKCSIFSLESQKNLRDFDLIGFSLGYELCYTNVLNILDLGGIPLKASERDASYPLIIGGGPSVLNPEPMHEFFDLFVIGEAEEVILELIYRYKELRASDKQGLLLELSKIEGVYVPSLYNVAYDLEGKISSFEPKFISVPAKIKKRFVQDFNQSYFPTQWLVPNIQVIHDRITLEIMRGCPNRCRFCQAKAQYFPLRVRSKENLLNLATQTYAATGYEEISLCGLSVSDHPQIEELLGSLIEYFKDKAVGISLPSIKPKDMVGNLAYLISTIKKTGFTFAPEAGSEKMRNILGKDFDLDVFWQALKTAYLNGYQHVKLYFMIGLPLEEDKDLDSISDFIQEASELRRQVSSRPAEVNISINTLIPKPHTAFQWCGMQDLAGIKYKQDYLRAKINKRRFKLSFHNLQMSILEGVFSRGDRRLSQVILAAFNKGARFDAWDEHFSFAKWEAAFNESGVDHNFYLKGRSLDEILPWDFLDIGINKDLLAAEFNKLIAIK